jgi:hypothetical protein
MTITFNSTDVPPGWNLYLAPPGTNVYPDLLVNALIIALIFGAIFFGGMLLLFKVSGGFMNFKAKFMHNIFMIRHNPSGSSDINLAKPGNGNILWHKGAPMLGLAADGNIKSGLSNSSMGFVIGEFFKLRAFTCPPQLPLATEFFEMAGLTGWEEATLLNYFIANRGKRSLADYKPEELVLSTYGKAYEDEKDADKKAQMLADAAEVIRASNKDPFLDDLEFGEGLYVFGKVTLQDIAESVKQSTNIPTNDALKAHLEKQLETIPECDPKTPDWQYPVVSWSSEKGVMFKLGGLAISWNGIRNWLATNLRQDLFEGGIRAAAAEQATWQNQLTALIPLLIMIIIMAGAMSMVALTLHAIGMI